MKTIIIDNGKVFVKDWNSEKREDEVCEVAKDKFRLTMLYPVEIKNTTVEQFLNLFRENSQFYVDAFGAKFGHHPMEPFLKEMDEKAVSEQFKEMESVAVKWRVNNYENQIEIYCDTHLTDKNGQIWATEGTNLGDLKNLQIILNTKFDVPDEGYGSNKKILESSMDFTVADVFSAIMGDVAWHGTPEKRDAWKEEFRQIIKDLQAGKIETHTIAEWDEINKAREIKSPE